MMGWSPQCVIPSFVEIGLPVPEKKIFEGFLPYMGVGGHLCHVSKSAVNKLSYPLPKEASHKIWLRLAQLFQRRRSLSIVNDDN